MALEGLGFWGKASVLIVQLFVAPLHMKWLPISDQE
jgi:hypothetical protein